ncbi:hypothetical protein [Ethanoligenens harbinense]|uniref:Uncharacterized protein n=1 Tax=Ethanoligenens harbinense (strain DSM 18485 / JCM 12961 / CGMCC 1.5033 / YUAN-3) TaxID=663278 RepID=E6U388_ETHHY|nr:hypothetical protein [Ethanoligenens harbinense]ADU27560.1 hypothetical protein Ethha_2043 [Ethanoligenens harbinense YUAN-3]AVQ96606.1 hypothetical protein CXQ68_10465 [Ethanoligenens harbinense YUAN-3]AYF39267.1 hypothetical protein CXP51_10355 [Ethanoligenens harbinense]AYF42091.1 hypothetical protein CN246_10905 [Ethanoligenens harbinense]QCN92846.1 hypothetical protein DRA42_10495 [Ethanoligenens harbinense]
MLKKRFVTGAAALALAAALVFPAGAATVKAAAPTSSGTSSSSASSGTPGSGTAKHQKCHIGGDRVALVLLADLSGKSVKDLKQQYPQQTPWQIAKQTNNLDALKKRYLEKQQQRIRAMQDQGSLSQADGTKLYEELAQRVAKIDGVKIVTVGHVHA